MNNFLRLPSRLTPAFAFDKAERSRWREFFLWCELIVSIAITVVALLTFYYAIFYGLFLALPMETFLLPFVFAVTLTFATFSRWIITGAYFVLHVPICVIGFMKKIARSIAQFFPHCR